MPGALEMPNYVIHPFMAFDQPKDLTFCLAVLQMY